MVSLFLKLEFLNHYIRDHYCIINTISDIKTNTATITISIKTNYFIPFNFNFTVV